jgi:hypothetical protein
VVTVIAGGKAVDMCGEAVDVDGEAVVGVPPLGKNTVAAVVCRQSSKSEPISHEERRHTNSIKAANRRNVRTGFFFTIATSSVI